jgi:hypothetical protein
MHTRYRAAATALLLTATTGLAATGGAAQASRAHHAAHHATKLVVTIKTRSGNLTLSRTKLRPGNTIFKVAPHGKGGDLQVLRLKPGYTMGQAFQDVGAAFGGDAAAVRRVDKHVVFYGGAAMSPKGGEPNFWGVRIDKRGKYVVLNTDTNALTTFKAKGKRQKRVLPGTDGWLNMVPGASGAGDAFKAGKHDAAQGWMSTTNRTGEPHFTDIQHVKKGTKPGDVSDYFADPNPPEVPPFAAKDGAFASSGIVSPGKTFVWSYHLPRGRFLALCFWPSKVDGMPHAFMGMWKLFDLH